MNGSNLQVAIFSRLLALNKNPAVSIVFSTSFQYTCTCTSSFPMIGQLWQLTSFGFMRPESNIHVELRNPPTPHSWWTTFDILTWEMVFREVGRVVGGLRYLKRHLQALVFSLPTIFYSFIIITARLLFLLIHTDREPGTDYIREQCYKTCLIVLWRRKLYLSS